jgi:hypothetical protein
MAILAVTLMPTTTAADSTIEVINLSHESYFFTYQQLAEMPQTNVDAELFCYGNQQLLEAGWSTTAIC